MNPSHQDNDDDGVLQAPSGYLNAQNPSPPTHLKKGKKKGRAEKSWDVIQNAPNLNFTASGRPFRNAAKVAIEGIQHAHNVEKQTEVILPFDATNIWFKVDGYDQPLEVEQVVEIDDSPLFRIGRADPSWVFTVKMYNVSLGELLLRITEEDMKASNEAATKSLLRRLDWEMDEQRVRLPIELHGFYIGPEGDRPYHDWRWQSANDEDYITKNTLRLFLLHHYERYRDIMRVCLVRRFNLDNATGGLISTPQRHFSIQKESTEAQSGEKERPRAEGEREEEEISQGLSSDSAEY
jgi:hypothetical protein